MPPNQPASATRARTHFHDELNALEERALGGIDIVLDQLDRTLEALAHQDVELAAIVIADDDRVDGRYLEVHQGVLSLLARQAPVAGDLRLVASLLLLFGPSSGLEGKTAILFSLGALGFTPLADNFRWAQSEVFVLLGVLVFFRLFECRRDAFAGE